MTATLTTNWPAMKVHPVRLRKEWLTADEVASGTLTGDVVAEFPTIDLPPTYVTIHRGAVLAILFGDGDVGTVDACTAKSPDGALVIALDPEPVVMTGGQMVAKAMPATAKVFLPDSGWWSSVGVEQPDGYGVFPDCPLVNGVASQVVAKFVLERID